MDDRRVEIDKLLQSIISRHLPEPTWDWLSQKAAAIKTCATTTELNTAFVLIPRKTGRQPLELTNDESLQVEALAPASSFSGWTIDRLCRVWLLMQVPAADERTYHSSIQNLFNAAEMNELVALYSALPFWAYPTAWKQQCAEGIRGNIGSVLEAIMYDNPYPAEYLDENAWNQLVLKAFFTEKDINRVAGIDKRANQKLADTLLDYVSERWAAGRTVSPQLWRLVGPFINQNTMPYLQKLFASDNIAERQAAALACNASGYQPGKQLVEQYPDLTEQLKNNELNWNNIH